MKNKSMAPPVRENRLRLWAEHQGYQLQRSRARNPRDITYRGYQLFDPEKGAVILGWGNSQRGFAASLDEIEEFLTRTPKPKRAAGAAAMR